MRIGALFLVGWNLLKYLYKHNKFVINITMTSVRNAVAQVVEKSEFARKGLRQGLLNISAYAKVIQSDVEALTKKEASASSIVMALSRYGRQLQGEVEEDADPGITTISIRSKVAALTYARTTEAQERLTMLNLLEAIKGAQYFVAIVGRMEVVVVIDAILKDVVAAHFGSMSPTIEQERLVSMLLQFDIQKGNEANVTYRVLEQLESRNITPVNVIAGSAELNILLHENESTGAYETLHKAFLLRRG